MNRKEEKQNRKKKRKDQEEEEAFVHKSNIIVSFLMRDFIFLFYY
jgi:hypothetical protein